MCGICGIINLEKQNINLSTLERMTNILSHRGPEDKGLWVDKNVGLGHRRLKIIDLTQQAAQPMTNENNSIIITYNGEIYNYKELRADLEKKGHIFKSASDVEIVLHAYEEWGPKCLDRFNGMWAFCIWDKNKGIFFLARDRLGIKPLYYFYKENVFVFASEIKSILEIAYFRKEINPQAIYEYLYFGYTLDDKTWFKGINKLLPGYYLIVDKVKLDLRKYWNLNSNIDYLKSEEDVKENIRNIFEDATRLRLRSDVEIGAHLSGGIDSSSVVGLTTKALNNNIHTFSGAFEESKEYDERAFIQEMLKIYPLINHHEIVIKPNNFLDVMKKIIWHLDEPIAGPGVYPQFFVSKLVHDSQFKVILGGQGGDELFGGYPYYYSGVIDSYLNLLKNNHNKIFLKYATDNISLKPFMQGLRRLISQSLNLKKKRLHRSLKREFLQLVDLKAVEEMAGFYKGAVEEMIYWDIKNYLPALLQVEDRVSMAFSVETRLPLLDHRLVEYAANTPFYFKVNKTNSKYILRKAVQDLLPLSIYERKDKKGFPTPFKLWILNNDFRKNMDKEIQDANNKIFSEEEGLHWEKLNIGIWTKVFNIIT